MNIVKFNIKLFTFIGWKVCEDWEGSKAGGDTTLTSYATPTSLEVKVTPTTPSPQESDGNLLNVYANTADYVNTPDYSYNGYKYDG